MKLSVLFLLIGIALVVLTSLVKWSNVFSSFISQYVYCLFSYLQIYEKIMRQRTRDSFCHIYILYVIIKNRFIFHKLYKLNIYICIYCLSISWLYLQSCWRTSLILVPSHDFNTDRNTSISVTSWKKCVFKLDQLFDTQNSMLYIYCIHIS